MAERLPDISDLIAPQSKADESVAADTSNKLDIEQVSEQTLTEWMDNAAFALLNDRLIAPEQDNAVFWYRKVLAVDPSHLEAMAGLDHVADRYLTSALSALESDLYERTEYYLKQAEDIVGDTLSVRRVRTKLSKYRQSEVFTFSLDPKEVRAKSRQLRQKIIKIGLSANKHEAYFIIRAANDADGRWIVRQLQQGLPNQRLRGDIEITPEPEIKLRLFN